LLSSFQVAQSSKGAKQQQTNTIFANHAKKQKRKKKKTPKKKAEAEQSRRNTLPPGEGKELDWDWKEVFIDFFSLFLFNLFFFRALITFLMRKSHQQQTNNHLFRLLFLPLSPEIIFFPTLLHSFTLLLFILCISLSFCFVFGFFFF